MRHLVVAVLAVVVVNAQMTWWIVFALRENRTRLGLEREALITTGKIRAAQVAYELTRAEDTLGRELNRSTSTPLPTPDPFVSIDVLPKSRRAAGWSRTERGLELWLPAGSGMVRAVPSEAWVQALLIAPAGFELSANAEQSIPGVRLPAPFEGLQLRPTPERWEMVLDGYQKRIVMVVSEGSFFALLIFVMMGLLWKSLRREVELERQHQNFLSAITHELKSPLAAVRLALETVLGGRADEATARHFLENAVQDTERLQALVQKVLEVTRYSRGRRSIVLRPTNLSALVEDTLGSFARRAAAANARIESDVEGDVEAEVDGEAFPIAVSNLLENAIKYGGSPPVIQVRLWANGRDAVLTVRDNGAGIPESDVPLIFDRFFRSGDEMTRTTRGTGLGLYLVQEIITAHRGTVRVESTGADGTTFRITLPHLAPFEEEE